ncbi:hypothetical protein Natoc_2292 [Natronococcus occultus SP4]|uniref:Uncharacterized protein n=1 Tax=Natronococcus occultus SP4 TaxID=694430 RepID=L0K0I2_9EURY|nr:hypothetical protein Natoc_2292 [Natronococcus occultus SP4]
MIHALIFNKFLRYLSLTGDAARVVAATLPVIGGLAVAFGFWYVTGINLAYEIGLVVWTIVESLFWALMPF